MFDILLIQVVDKNYYLGPTCNSKLQIIKISFVQSAHPKRWGSPTSKIHLFNYKELEDDPHINGNGLMRTISLLWVYFQILFLIPLNSSICPGRQRPTHEGAKDHTTNYKSFNVFINISRHVHGIYLHIPPNSHITTKRTIHHHQQATKCVGSSPMTPHVRV